MSPSLMLSFHNLYMSHIITLAAHHLHREEKKPRSMSVFKCSLYEDAAKESHSSHMKTPVRSPRHLEVCLSSSSEHTEVDQYQHRERLKDTVSMYELSGQSPEPDSDSSAAASFEG